MKVWILSEWGGDYEDRWETIKGVFDNEELPLLIKKEKEQEMQSYRDEYNKKYELYAKEFDIIIDNGTANNEKEYERVNALMPEYDYHAQEWGGMKIKEFEINKR